MSPDFVLLAESSLAGERELPPAPPLTLTRNFGIVVAFCLLTLCTVPVVIAWLASLLLH